MSSLNRVFIFRLGSSQDDISLVRGISFARVRGERQK